MRNSFQVMCISILRYCFIVHAIKDVYTMHSSSGCGMCLTHLLGREVCANLRILTAYAIIPSDFQGAYELSASRPSRVRKYDNFSKLSCQKPEIASHAVIGKFTQRACQSPLCPLQLCPISAPHSLLQPRLHPKLLKGSIVSPPSLEGSHAATQFMQ